MRQEKERPYRRVVVINGYGCDLNSPLTPYLNRVRNFIVHNDVHNAIFCGGYTQRTSFPGRSEAQVMAEYIQDRLPDDYRLAVFLENQSYTTFDNCVEAVPIIRHIQHNLWDGQPPRPGELTVFCEGQRLAKVQVMYWLLLPDYRPCADGLRVRFEIDSWERANPLKEYTIKLFSELLMYFFPFWARRMRAKHIAASIKR